MNIQSLFIIKSCKALIIEIVGQKKEMKKNQIVKSEEVLVLENFHLKKLKQ